MKIYIASPLFSDMEKDYIDLVIQKTCNKLKLNPFIDIYSPIRDNNFNNWEAKIYNTNMENLNHCNIMIAILDGKDVDSGTAFEIGYFEAQNKTVFGLLSDKRSYDEDDNLNLKLNTMIFGSLNYGINIFSDIDDLINRLYNYLYNEHSCM